MTSRHPDSPRPAGSDDEINDVTRERQQDLGKPDLDEELGSSERDELTDEGKPGQNSDWLPQ